MSRRSCPRCHPLSRLRQGVLEHGQLGLSPHEGSKTTRYRRLQALPERAGTHKHV